MKLLLVIPNSSCDVERAFSVVRHIKTEFRCQLSHDTLVNLLSCKINLFSNSNCYEVQPSKRLLVAAMQSTHQYNTNLQSE